MAELQEKMSPEEEIKKLEQQLEQKKRTLAQTGAVAPEEKEIFREVLKEHIESLRSQVAQTPPSLPLPSAPVFPPPVHDEQAGIKKREVNESMVRMLVEKALTGTIEDAVREAGKISPYMVDELHDYLIEPLYHDKLLALRKIKQL